MKFYSPDTKEVIYSINSDQLFNPGSAMKLSSPEQPSPQVGPIIAFTPPFIAHGPVERTGFSRETWCWSPAGTCFSGVVCSPTERWPFPNATILMT